MQDTVETVLGHELESFKTWLYRFAGIDTVGCLPSGVAAHGGNEAVFVDDLVMQAQVYIATVRNLLGKLANIMATESYCTRSEDSEVDQRCHSR